MSQIHGHYDPAFKSLVDLFQQFLDQGEELGGSLCIDVDGKTVLDIWGGYADVASAHPWASDTLTVVWSSSKIITNLAAMVLVDRGQLDLDARVSSYWPEFAANGKENVLVRNILSHTSGLSGFEDITREELYDTPVATAKLAAQKPWWTPGTVSGYHMITQGFLVGELVRRISGKSLKQFIADELAGPLHADFRLGLPNNEYDTTRTAEIIPPPPFSPSNLDLSRMPLALKTFTQPPMKAEYSMTRGFRDAEIGASNGFTNARALTKLGSIVSLGGTVPVDGKPCQILSQKTVDRMVEEQIRSVDLVMGTEMSFALGFSLPTHSSQPWFPEKSTPLAAWGGWGGSLVAMDVFERATISYTPNKMGSGILGSKRSIAYAEAFFPALEEYKKKAKA